MTAYNVGKISEYAREAYDDRVYDEVYTEYRVVQSTTKRKKKGKRLK